MQPPLILHLELDIQLQSPSIEQWILKKFVNKQSNIRMYNTINQVLLSVFFLADLDFLSWPSSSDNVSWHDTLPGIKNMGLNVCVCMALIPKNIRDLNYVSKVVSKIDCKQIIKKTKKIFETEAFTGKMHRRTLVKKATWRFSTNKGFQCRKWPILTFRPLIIQ